jgi:hypothetical protein
MGVTGGGDVLKIPHQGMFLIRIHTERAGAARPQTLTQLLEQMGKTGTTARSSPTPTF